MYSQLRELSDLLDPHDHVIIRQKVQVKPQKSPFWAIFYSWATLGRSLHYHLTPLSLFLAYRSVDWWNL